MYFCCFAGFYFLFRDINQESFSTLPTTIMTLFQMTLGEFKVSTGAMATHEMAFKLDFATYKFSDICLVLLHTP